LSVEGQSGECREESCDVNTHGYSLWVEAGRMAGDWVDVVNTVLG
jgi:hypothetical protein